MGLDTGRTISNLRTLTTKFDLAVEAAKPFYPNLCYTYKSTGASETYGGLGSMPKMREWIGDRQFHRLSGADYTIKNRLWENSIEILKTDIDDDKWGMYNMVLSELGVEAARHPDELLFEALIAAESQPGLDGAYFFDTDHQWGESGVQSNDLTYNATDHTAVTHTEFLAAYHAARAAMLGFKKDNGVPYVGPTVEALPNLMVIVPPQLETAATKAFTAVYTTGGESNVVIDKPKIQVSPHLSTGTKFYLFNLGSNLKPFIFQARSPLQRAMKGLTDPEFKNVKFMTDARYNIGYFAWWNSVLTTFN